MGIESYLLRSGLLAVLCQRLVRRLCDCNMAVASHDALLGLPIPLERAREARGCENCLQTGYRGRTVLAEMLSRSAGTLTGNVLQRADAPSIQAAAIEAGLLLIWQRAMDAVANGLTSPAEIRRVLGSAEHLR
jgi:type II secretory ATPase GspE/PulE/Tfp pilus assembly ATPase PilB-like protein